MIRVLYILLLVGACNFRGEVIDELNYFPTEPESTTATRSSVAVDSAVIHPEGEDLAGRIQPPPGFERKAYPAESFGYFLQHFPLKPAGSKVMLFDGREKNRQDVHAAILDIDVGKRDLQQCADAVMRLRAEYLWQKGRFDDIGFSFVNGFSAPYTRWRSGERIRVAGQEVSWVRRTGQSESYSSFRGYLNMVFAYASTISLARDMSDRPIQAIEAGDVFIQAGSPGHAVTVMDRAVHPETGETLVLLAQSYMPAQDIHILNNFGDAAKSPWYSVRAFAEMVNTPEWRFRKEDLKKF